MKKTFTSEYVMANRGCYDREQVKNLSFYSKKRIHIKDLFKSELNTKDAYWFLFKKCDLTLKEKLSHCLELAEIVLPICEKTSPDDKRLRDCICAVKDFNKGKISRSDLQTYTAHAYNAAYDASASASADAAVAAADAAYAATYAHAYNADAAADDAADSAADAAADAEFKNKIIECTIKFIDSK